MNPHYNRNYAREEIDTILEKIKNCVSSKKYTIALNENRTVVISFHKRNKPITYLFK